MKQYLDSLKHKKSLSQEDACDALNLIFSGTQKDEDIKTFLSLLNEKGESVNEILGFCKAMKENCIQLHHDLNEPIVDICGTGGSGKNRFNISTCVTFVLAAGGINVAKHGNYGSQRPNGSFNFLEEMNIDYHFKPEEIIRLLKGSHMCFLFARAFHPAMKYVSKARRSLAHKTIFNLIGPLVNPMAVDYHVIGLASEDKLPLLVDTVKRLPIKKVVFCIGGDGRDEVSLFGDTKLITVSADETTEELFNFQKEIDSNVNDYYCGDSHENAAIFSHLLIDFEWSHPIIKHICINAAVALKLLNKVSTLKEGYDKSMKLFETQDVTRYINRYKSLAVDIKEALSN